jgi:exodeoxyribonuclease V beta subunit
LQDNAFESGSHYDTELVTDQIALLQEVADDFWRMHFFSSTAPLLGYALRSGCSPEKFTEFLKGMHFNPKLEIIPGFDSDEIEAMEEACRVAFEKVRKLWTSSRIDVEDILLKDKGLSRSADNYREDQVTLLLDGMTTFVAGTNPFDLFDGFDKFCTERIEEQRLNILLRRTLFRPLRKLKQRLISTFSPFAGNWWVAETPPEQARDKHRF